MGNDNQWRVRQSVMDPLSTFQGWGDWW